jgi:hypothetical protein
LGKDAPDYIQRCVDLDLFSDYHEICSSYSFITISGCVLRIKILGISDNSYSSRLYRDKK